MGGAVAVRVPPATWEVRKLMRCPALNEWVTEDRRIRLTVAICAGAAVPISNVSPY